MYLIRNACVISMDGERSHENHDVLVDGDRISAVEPTGRMDGAGASVIDGTRKFVIPGLIDTHGHFAGPKRAKRFDMGTEELNRIWADLSLINGVTTVLSLDGEPEILEFRDRVIAGVVDGPTLHSAGPILNDPEITYEQARAEVRSEAEIGYEFVKVYNDLTAAAYQGVIEEAAEQGLRVLGHVCRAPGLAGTLLARQSAIVHAEEILYTGFEFRVGVGAFDWAANAPLLIEELPRICERVAESGVTMMPCVVAFYAIFQQAQDPDSWYRTTTDFECFEKRVLEKWKVKSDSYVQRFAPTWARRNLLEGYWFQVRLVEQLRAVGVPMTAGTDWGIPGVLPTHLHLELSTLALAGLGDAGALEAATRVGGEFLEPGSGLGTIVPGARADLLVLDADPLKDVRNARRISGVFARGRWHSQASLDARARALRARAIANETVRPVVSGSDGTRRRIVHG